MFKKWVSAHKNRQIVWESNQAICLTFENCELIWTKAKLIWDLGENCITEM